MFEKLKFRLTFGVSPTYETDAEKEQIQRAVDMRLRDLAVAFLSECYTEEMVDMPKPENAKDVRENVCWLRCQHKLVLEAKSRFWAAHALAKWFCFEVKERAKEYLGGEDDHLKAVKASDYN